VARTRVPVAIVTGAAHGIGRAISRQLLETGWRVGVVDLPGSRLKRSYNRYGRKVVPIEGDVTDEETVRRAVGAVTDKFNRLDALGRELINPSGWTTRVRFSPKATISGRSATCREVPIP
jgi:NAD(P)-dependent dehydrogenase (short-subunit alcohol dehydrogenase family)